MKRLFLVIFCIGTLASSCALKTDFPIDQEEVSAREGLSTDRIQASPTGGVNVVTLSSGKPWKITGMPSWVDISPVEGNPGTKEIKITTRINDSYADRDGSVFFVIEGSDESIPLSIMQPCPYIKINGGDSFEGKYSFKWFESRTAFGNPVELTIESNTTWSISLDGFEGSITGNGSNCFDMGWLFVEGSGESHVNLNNQNRCIEGQGSAVIRLTPDGLNLGSEVNSSTLKIAAPAETDAYGPLYTSRCSVSQENLRFMMFLDGNTFNPKDTLMFKAVSPDPKTMSFECDYGLSFSVPEWMQKSESSSSLRLSVIGNGVNPEEVQRNGNLKIKIDASDYGIAPVFELPIAQEAYVLDVPSSVTIGNESNAQRSFSVYSSGDWELVDTPAWLHVSANSGKPGLTDLVLTTASQNLETRPRSISVTCKSKLNSISKTINIEQAKFAFDIEYQSSIGALPKSSYSMNIDCSGEWEIQNAPKWIKLSKTSGSGNQGISYTVDKNLALESRSAAMKIVSKRNSLTKDIAIAQDAYIFDSTGASYTGSALDPKSYEFEVKCTGSWTISGAPDWLNVSQTSGSGNSKVTLSLRDNQMTFKRTAELVVVCDDNPDYTKVISVSQEAFSFDDKDVQLSFTASAEQKNVDIKCAGSWSAKVQGSANWVSVSPANGSGSAPLSISVKSNSTKKSRERTATVIVTSDLDGKTKTISIRQAGKK